MSIQPPQRSSYTTLDFREWRDTSALIVAPKFQRRGVWTTPQRSYLIDTMLKGLPIPPVYLRVGQAPDRRKTVREVVDGQQRITAALLFLDDELTLSKSLDAPYAGKRFSQLKPNDQEQLRSYSFNCEVFQGISDADILEVFARLNTYSVKLNAQELRNGRFFGYFKQSAYQLAREYLEFWRQKKLFSERGIARMSEVEFVSELLVAQLAGMQDKKKSLDGYYEQYDSEFSNRKPVVEQFQSTMGELEYLQADELGAFTRKPLFYSLYCAAFHRLFRLPNATIAGHGKKRLSQKDRAQLRDAVVELSDAVEANDEDKRTAKEIQTFVEASKQQTDNIKPRDARFKVIFRRAFG